MDQIQIVVIAGLPVLAYDYLKKSSSKRFAPNGHLIAKPTKHHHCYPPSMAWEFVREVYNYLLSLEDKRPVSILLAYVNYSDATTAKLAEAFFPFALACPLAPLDLSSASSPNKMNQILNMYVGEIAEALVNLRRASGAIRSETSGNNLTPLWLPVRNFRSEYLIPTLRGLYDELINAKDPMIFVEYAVRDICNKHPLTRPPREPKRCFTDGIHFFKSPGRDRHGYFHNSGAAAHKVYCLLNARSRLGAPISHNFHYDCEGVHGRLSEIYSNCHDEKVRPRQLTHVNIAPNDYII